MREDCETSGPEECTKGEPQCSPHVRPTEILGRMAKRLREKAHALEQLADQLEYINLGPEASRMLCSLLLSARE